MPNVSIVPKTPATPLSQAIGSLENAYKTVKSKGVWDQLMDKDNPPGPIETARLFSQLPESQQSSLPFLGEYVKGAQKLALQKANQEATDKVLAREAAETAAFRNPAAQQIPNQPQQLNAIGQPIAQPGMQANAPAGPQVTGVMPTLDVAQSQALAAPAASAQQEGLTTEPRATRGTETPAGEKLGPTPEQEIDFLKGQLANWAIHAGNEGNPGLQKIAKEKLANIREQIKGIERGELAEKRNKIAERKVEATERKETKEYSDKVLGDYESYQDTEAHLKKLKNLDAKGKLAGPILAQLSKLTGIPLSILSNPDTEEAQKVMADMLRGVNSAYRGRILASQFKAFAATVPDLTNSKEGRAKIYRNIEIFETPKRLQYEAYRDIIKENGGKRPIDIHERVLERIDPELQRLADEFNREDFSEEAAKEKRSLADIFG